MSELTTFPNEFPELIIHPDNSSGIEIRAKLGVKYNCAEFTLRDDVPQAIFISPWMQFEPRTMNEHRLMLAHAIVYRANAYNGFMKQIDDAEKQREANRKTYDRYIEERDKIIEDWRNDIKRIRDGKVTAQQLCDEYKLDRTDL